MTFNDIRKSFNNYDGCIVVQKSENSMLVIAGKRIIILPEKNNCGETHGHIVITISARC